METLLRSPIPKGKKSREETPLSLVTGCKSAKINCARYLGDVFKDITNPANEKLIQFTDELRRKRQSDKAAYSKMKEKLSPGFVIGRFSDRKDKSCKEYVPLLGFDIDNIEEYLVEIFRNELEDIPHVFAAFPSPSGEGLRVLMWCDSTIERHKSVHRAGCEFLSQKLNLPIKKSEDGYIDTSTGNVSRIWFYCHVPQDCFYVNWNSPVFVPNLDQGYKSGSNGSQNHNGHHLSEDEKVEIVKGQLERRNTPDGRNNYTYTFAKLLKEHGVSSSRVEAECLKLVEPGFERGEVAEILRKTDGTSPKFTDEQILNYKERLKSKKKKEHRNEPEGIKPLMSSKNSISAGGSFYHIGDKFFEAVPNRFGGRDVVQRSERSLVLRESRDFVNNLAKGKTFCHGFTVEPSHKNYQEIICENGFKYFNRYSPLPHSPKAGSEEDIQYSINYLKHIFGTDKFSYRGKQYERFELGLDYLQILLTKPKERLPVLILFSKERNSGKSTLNNWLQLVLGSNAVKVSSDTFSNNFNEFYADKLLIYCDEAFLDRYSQAERIKDLSTSPFISINPKGRSQYQLPFYGKFVFTSNNENMIHVTKESERFWILTVPPLTGRDVGYLEKLRKEIPYFLHFLQNRSMVTEKESRMHFHKDLIITDTFFQTVKENEPKDVVELREGLRELFFYTEEVKPDIFEDSKDPFLLLPSKDIKKVFFNGRIHTKRLKKILKYLGVDGPFDVTRGKYVVQSDVKRFAGAGEDEEHDQYKIENFVGRPYKFMAEDFAPEIVKKKN